MTDFEQLLATLHTGGVRFIIVGGLAATIHGSSRLTQDLDVVYQRSDDTSTDLRQHYSPISRTCAARRLVCPSTGLPRPFAGA